ncbi:MAG: hypothetical protein CL610_02450 [Anaerolineaceae bacterium]|nr:hypothetical protein [Anaerolineaceae bacterium]
MTQWEYLTLFLEAQVHKEDEDQLKRRFDKKKLPRHTPESMIPELDQLGAARWELVHMEPVPKVGGNGDILFHGAPRWSSTYFCVFKRPRPEPSQHTSYPPQQPQSLPQPPESPSVSAETDETPPEH